MNRVHLYTVSRIQRRSIHSLDDKWIRRWAALPNGRPEPPTKPGAAKYYQLPMFPYPSGRLHIGHLRVYTISDVLARFRRMQGRDVIHPIGWDAFGLPAENAAIEHGVNAADWTYNHINLMRDQLMRMLVDMDWNREVITCDPEYYKQTQRIFLEFFRAGLAERRKANVNWDPVDKTVLANEQIDAEGRSWRSGAIAEQRELEQWFLKITNYASRLSNQLEILQDWPVKVKNMQRNWIGLSEGTEVRFSDDLVAFTTRLETLPGVKFLAIASDHPIAIDNAANTSLNGLIEGVEALHPLTGEPIPVYTADYVVSGYGTSVVMGVPAHDERDRVFWEAVTPNELNVPVYNDATGTMCDSAGLDLANLDVSSARAKILKQLEDKNEGRPAKHVKLRDWLISRQRFWGAPIPVVHCGNCGIVSVPDDQLPVKLPEGTTNIPLSQNEEWLQTECPECHGPAHRDPDTMDTFMDSSWYYFRFLDPHNGNEPFSREIASPLMPVDCYVGGIEHAILHLLYSRFLAQFLADRGFWDGGDLLGEPFRKLITQGMVHGKTFKDKETGRYLKPHEIPDVVDTDQIEVSMEKMSKSKHNGVDPLQVINTHGADATRAHIIFSAPVDDFVDWDGHKIVGIERWLGRVQKLGTSLSASSEVVQIARAPSASEVDLWNEVCTLTDLITESLLTERQLNTIVSDYMKLTRAAAALEKTNIALARRAYEVLVKVIAPLCPASAEEYWQQLTNSDPIRRGSSVHSQQWPKIAPMQASNEAEFRVIVNSKPAGTLSVSAEASQDELIDALGLDTSAIKRVIFKPQNRVISVVTGEQFYRKR